jgi:type 1 glutamine amidotransferase
MKKILLLIWALPMMAFAQTKVCLVSASAEYASHDSLAKLQEDLERGGITCFRAFGEDKGNGIPGIEKLVESDVLVLFTRRVVLPPEQMELVRNHLDAGKPVVGIRTASHGIQNWQPDVKSLDKEIFGGSYDGHYKNDEPAELIRAAGQEGHAVFKGVEPFVTDGKLYKNESLAEGVTVLLTAKNASGQTQPVAWTRNHAGGKVFYTSLGVQSDFAKPEFRKFLVNAVEWTAKK